MKPFDLDRFKAGEPAYCKTDPLEYFYLAELPDGKISFKYFEHDEWWCYTETVQKMNDEYYMKEKELTWQEVRIMWLNGRVNSLSDTNLIDWLDANFEAPKRKNQ